MILVAMLIILLDNPGQKSEHMSSHLISFLHFLLISFKTRLKFVERPRADLLGFNVHGRQLRIRLPSQVDASIFALQVASGLGTLSICGRGGTSPPLVHVMEANLDTSFDANELLSCIWARWRLSKGDALPFVAAGEATAAELVVNIARDKLALLLSTLSGGIRVRSS